MAVLVLAGRGGSWGIRHSCGQPANPPGFPSPDSAPSRWCGASSGDSHSRAWRWITGLEAGSGLSSAWRCSFDEPGGQTAGTRARAPTHTKPVAPTQVAHSAVAADASPSREHEAVELVPAPRRVAHGGHGRPGGRRVGPVPRALVRVVPWRTVGDPCAQPRERLGRERSAVLGHALVGVGGREPAQELALLRRAGDDQRIATLEQARALVESQPALLFVGAVADEALRAKKSAYVALEAPVGLGRSQGALEGESEEQERRSEDHGRHVGDEAADRPEGPARPAGRA